MALSSTFVLRPGSYYLWNAEYAAIPDLAHTCARVLLLGLDDRPPESWACYLVDGTPPQLTCCRLTHFQASCTPDPGAAWVPVAELPTALAHAAAAIADSPAPGDYPFTPERRAGLPAVT